MKRRLLALFGIFALCMSLLAVDAAAAEGETVSEEAVPAQRVIVGGVELDDSQGPAYALTDSAGAVTTEGAGADSWNLRLEDGVLTLKDAVIAQGFAHDGGCAGIYAEADLELVLTGESAIGGTGMNEGVYALGNLTIGGDGSLDISVSGESSCSGIACEDWMTITSGTLDISAASESGDCCGIKNGGGDLVISGGQVSVSAASQSGTGYGVFNGYELYLTGGSLSAAASSGSGDSWGIRCTYYLVVQGDETFLTAQGGTQAIAGGDELFCETLLYDITGKKTVQIAGGRVTADAADLAPLGGESVWVNGVQIYGGAESGSVEGTSYDPATNTLTLDGAYITTAYDCEEESCVAGIYSSGNLNIKLVGTNTIVGGSDMSDGINVLGRLTIDGPGSLDILLENEIDGLTAIAGGYLYLNGCTLNLTCRNTTYGVYGLFTQFDVSLSGSTVNIDCVSDSSAGMGIFAYDDLIMNDSTMNISANAALYTVGIISYRDVIISGGALTASAAATGTGQCNGLFGSESVTIRDCTVRLSADAESEKYLASGICTDGSLTVSGSDITAEGRDCGVELGFPASSVFSLDGGKLTAISQEGAGVGASGAELTLRVGPEGTLVLNAPTPIEYVGTGSGFSYTVVNEGALIAGVESAEQAQKFLAGGGSLNGVTAQNWYCDAMCYMWANGLLDYTDDGQYAPAAPLSQGTLADAAEQLTGQSAAVEELLAAMGGFDPAASITREDLVVFLYRCTQALGGDVSVGEDTNILSYADAAQVSESAMAAVQWACGAGIIRGTGDGSLINPQADATCAEAAAIFLRWSQLTAA